MLNQLGVGGLIGLGVGLVGLIYAVIAVLKIPGQRKIRGPALTGTGRVLSLKVTGVQVANFRSKYRMCVVGLQVEVPGREPYDVTVRQPLGLPEIGALQPGNIVPVQVAADNPRKVRIDVNRPTTVDPANPRTVYTDLSQPSQRGQQAGSPASPDQFADQVKTALEEKLRQMPGMTVLSDNSGSIGSPSNLADLADAFRQSPGSVPAASAAEVLASGQRVPGVLKSFAATGTTLRSLGRTSTRPELLDAPQYLLEVELRFPNLTPLTGRSVQPVPVAKVPDLSIGRQLACAVDPADPSHRFVIDWDATTQ